MVPPPLFRNITDVKNTMVNTMIPALRYFFLAKLEGPCSFPFPEDGLSLRILYRIVLSLLLLPVFVEILTGSSMLRFLRKGLLLLIPLLALAVGSLVRFRMGRAATPSIVAQ